MPQEAENSSDQQGWRNPSSDPQGWGCQQSVNDYADQYTQRYFSDQEISKNVADAQGFWYVQQLRGDVDEPQKDNQEVAEPHDDIREAKSQGETQETANSRAAREFTYLPICGKLLLNEDGSRVNEDGFRIDGDETIFGSTLIRRLHGEAKAQIESKGEGERITMIERLSGVILKVYEQNDHQSVN